LEIAIPIFTPWTRFWKSPSKFSLLNWPTWR
jgi:hypothetical protein